MIYISTGLIKNQSAFKTSDIFLNDGIYNIELSGGLFEKDLINKIKKLKKKGKIFNEDYSNKLIENLNFKLTNNQIEIIKQINNDLKSNIKMFRLLQGDV